MLTLIRPRQLKPLPVAVCRDGMCGGRVAAGQSVPARQRRTRVNDRPLPPVAVAAAGQSHQSGGNGADPADG
jgi:hypothetical protein